jgi:hypothetical protein
MMKMLGVVRNDIFHIKDGKTSGGSKISNCQKLLFGYGYCTEVAVV